MIFRIATLLAAGGMLMASAPGHPGQAANQKLDTLMKDYWEYTLRTSPESATAVGDPRYNDRLSDNSLGARQD